MILNQPRKAKAIPGEGTSETVGVMFVGVMPVQWLNQPCWMLRLASKICWMQAKGLHQLQSNDKKYLM
jgi:hypothetical protein